MASRAKIAALRNHCVLAYLDLCHRVKDNSLSNPGIVTNAQSPRIDYRRGWRNENVLSYLSAKTTKKPPPEAKREERRPPENCGLNDPPQLDEEQRPSPESFGEAKGR